MTFECLLLAVLCAAPQGDEDVLQERYRVAAEAKERALERLEREYAGMDAALAAWRAQEATRETSLVSSLLRTIHGERDALEAIRDRETAPSARRRIRAEQTRHLSTALRVALSSRGLDDDGLLDALSERLARDTVSKVSSDQLEASITRSLGGVLETSQPFHVLWNDWLFQHHDAAVSYQRSYDEHIAVGVELDRARNPHQYQPGGQRVRAGMVYVPGGRYRVGPNTGFERKKRTISLRPYLMDEREVSHQEYEVFVEAQPEESRAELVPRTWVADDDGIMRPPPDLLDHPVTGVTWRHATRYARWIGKRLPTEDEWEVACAGPDEFDYPWGETYLDGHANDAELQLEKTVATGRLPHGASPFGVLHLAGNVEEWTASHEDGDVLERLMSNIAPMVVRGGHYLSARENVGARFRWVAPGGSTREPYLGFRCAADLDS